MLKIAHIVIPVVVKETSDLYTAQPITFESMKLAKSFAEGQVDVKLVAAKFSDEQGIVPDGFMSTADLDRSVLNIGSFKEYKKLPILKDALDRLNNTVPEADYYVFTNVDIALMPHFYVTLSKIIEDGFDAFVINRRTIPDHYNKPDELPLMYSEIGAIHPGYDCFVFRKEAYTKYKLFDTCLGSGHIGKALIANLITYSAKFKIFKNEHLTFHIGNDRVWKGKEVSDFAEHNKKELLLTLQAIEADTGKFNRNKMPGSFYMLFESSFIVKSWRKLISLLKSRVFGQ